MNTLKRYQIGQYITSLLFATTITLLCSLVFAAAPFERREVTVNSQGLKCAAFYYVPKNMKTEEKRPAIVMAHGWSGVKEHIESFASKFAEAGLVVLLFDYRYLGGSEGEPRGQLIYHDQHQDYRNAITWVSLQKEVDPERIGIWGTSFAGGHVLHLAAFDKRVKAVVSQMPVTNIWQAYYEPEKPEALAAGFAFYAKARTERYATGKTAYVPVVAPEGEFASIPGKEAYEYVQKNLSRHRTWRNEVTVESLESSMEYDPTANIHLISPTPLLMVVASDDTVTPTELEKKAFERAKEPKKLVVVKGRHFDLYDGSGSGQAATAAAEWFQQHLKP